MYNLGNRQQWANTKDHDDDENWNAIGKWTYSNKTQKETAKN